MNRKLILEWKVSHLASQLSEKSIYYELSLNRYKKTIKWMTNIDVIPKSEINVKIKCKVYVHVKQFSKTFKLCFGS